MNINIDQEKINQIKEKAQNEHVPILQDDTLQVIEVILDMIKPGKILEVGTAVGYSASIFAKYLDISKKGYITTIERNESRYQQAKDNIEQLGLKEHVHLVLADAVDYLTSLQDEFDVVFIDAAKGQYLKFLKEAKRLVKDGGVILADNVLFKGRVLGDYDEHRNRTAVNRLREYLHEIEQDPMLRSTVLQIGDGLSISVVHK